MFTPVGSGTSDLFTSKEIVKIQSFFPVIHLLFSICYNAGIGVIIIKRTLNLLFSLNLRNADKNESCPPPCTQLLIEKINIDLLKIE